MKILLMEDDRQFTHLLQSALSQHYSVDVAIDETQAWELARSHPYDLIVLDTEDSKLDSIHFCQALRKVNNLALLMLLVAKGNSINIDANDYVTKPATASEVEARIHTLLRGKPVTASMLEWGLLRLDLNTCEATFANTPLKLTAKEYAILELFLSNQQRIYSQSALLERLWSVEDLAAGENAVRTHIKRLRQKLKSAGAPELLETVYGLGYRLNEACRSTHLERSLPISSSSLQAESTNGTVHRSTPPIITPAKTTDAKVIILDDDLLTLRLLQGLLEPWGFQVTTLNHPQDFWDCLNRINPDLLILDVQMPETDGIELCQTIRNDRQWAWLPILFLTASKDSETIQQVFAAGADDYISKPVVAAELIARILNRLERIRLLRTQAELDPLTGLLNRVYSSQAIEQQLHQAEQAQQSFCLAVLEIQNFKQLNIQHGYESGDRLLRQTAQTLRQQLQENDVVAYWQSGDFVIGLCDVDRDRGIKQMQDILAALRRQMDTAIEKLPVSIALNVVQYPKDGATLQELYQAAIEKLAIEKLT